MKASLTANVTFPLWVLYISHIEMIDAWHQPRSLLRHFSRDSRCFNRCPDIDVNSRVSDKLEIQDPEVVA